MRRFIGLGVAVSVILFPLFSYIYVRGCVDGVVRYQRSRRFALTLYSMYRYGVLDGCRGGSICKGGKVDGI